MSLLRPLILVSVILVGCTEGSTVPAVVPELLVPDEVEVEWDAQFDDAEGVGALLPIDLMVYDTNTGEPLSNMDLTIEGSDDVDFLQILPADAVENVGAACDDCFWDAGRDRYITFESPDALAIDVQTDAEGLARVYVWVDALPYPTQLIVSAPQFEPTPQHTFELRSAQ